MERIARVAGQINQHKNQQAGLVPPQSSHTPPHHRTSVESRNSNRASIDGLEDSGYSGSWRHQRGGYPYPTRAHYTKPVHRHRTLVLNGASQQQGKAGQPSSGATSDSSTSSWVAKNDRHLQLINSSIYHKGAQARTRAIEQTLRQKQQQRDDLERTKLINHLHRAGNRSAAVPNQYELTVQGIRFAVTKNGSKLVKIPGASKTRSQALAVPNTHRFTGDLNSGPTPKMAIVGGVKFYRSKNGNLYRHGIVKAQRYVARSPLNHPLTLACARQSGAVKKVNVPCRNFSMTGNSNFPDFGTSTDTTSKRLGLVSPKDVYTDIHPQVHAPKAPGADTSTTRPRLPFARTFSNKGNALTVTLAIFRTNSPLNAPPRACTSLGTVAQNLTANSLTQKCLQLPRSAESLASTATARRVPAALTAMFSNVPTSATLACVIPRVVNCRTGRGRAYCVGPMPATTRRWRIYPAKMNQSIAMMSTRTRLTSLLARTTILTWISPSKRTSFSFDWCGPGSSVLVLGFS